MGGPTAAFEELTNPSGSEFGIMHAVFIEIAEILRDVYLERLEFDIVLSFLDVTYNAKAI